MLLLYRMEMKDHFELSDLEFEGRFSSKKLAPYTFTHEAHLRLVWIHITKYGAKQGEKNVRKQIENYVAYLSADDKYHVTLTAAATKVIHQFMKKSRSSGFKEFLTEFPELKADFKELVQSRYSFNIFESKEAKTRYIEPDLKPF